MPSPCRHQPPPPHPGVRVGHGSQAPGAAALPLERALAAITVARPHSVWALLSCLEELEAGLAQAQVGPHHAARWQKGGECMPSRTTAAMLHTDYYDDDY